MCGRHYGLFPRREWGMDARRMRERERERDREVLLSKHSAFPCKLCSKPLPLDRHVLNPGPPEVLNPKVPNPRGPKTQQAQDSHHPGHLHRRRQAVSGPLPLPRADLPLHGAVPLPQGHKGLPKPLRVSAFRFTSSFGVNPCGFVSWRSSTTWVSLSL